MNALLVVAGLSFIHPGLLPSHNHYDRSSGSILILVFEFLPAKSRSRYFEFLPAKIEESISILNFFPPNRGVDFYFDFLPAKSRSRLQLSINTTSWPCAMWPMAMTDGRWPTPTEAEVYPREKWLDVKRGIQHHYHRRRCHHQHQCFWMSKSTNRWSLEMESAMIKRR